ncbi:MAG: hypothetical protein P8N43_12600 [Alphaproteobacteria bacterium]|nr:hypothetical protein [Alphaproteobacteria bacterium]
MPGFNLIAKTKLSQRCDPDIFSMVNLPIAKTNPLDELTPYQSFDARFSILAVKKIDPSSEGAFHKIIYTNHELKEHLDYLKSKLWDDDRF